MTYFGPGTILGGLPVIAELSAGKDADTPNGPGEYWNEVEAVYWQRRDGTRGKQISEKVLAKAEQYDYGLCTLMEQVNDHVAYEQYKREERERIVRDNPDDFVTAEDGYVYYWPLTPAGAYSSANLRLLADILDERNEAWDKQVTEDLSNANSKERSEPQTVVAGDSSTADVEDEAGAPQALRPADPELGGPSDFLDI